MLAGHTEVCIEFIGAAKRFKNTIIFRNAGSVVQRRLAFVPATSVKIAFFNVSSWILNNGMSDSRVPF